MEDIPRTSAAGGQAKVAGADWLASWPLTTQDYSQNNTAKITPCIERWIVRDWVRMAEDLIASADRPAGSRSRTFPVSCRSCSSW